MYRRTRQILFLILNQYLRRLVVSSLGSFPEGTTVLPQGREIAAASSEQIRICGRHSTCSKQDSSFNSSCCGSCTCDKHCSRHASCCLDVFGEFEYARFSIQRTRYGCVSTQYLTSENTDFNTDKAVWMLTKCATDYTDVAIMRKCEHPDQLVESVVPVSVPFMRKHFKNIHCAYCNWYKRDKTLIYWKLQILSNQALSFPNDNLIHVINKTRGNIFFIQPEIVATESCTPVPDYLIETCNETGLWTEYSADTESACASFIDPFNHTYKNYFCYKCNTAATMISPDSLTCPIKAKSGSLKSPEFSAVVGLQSVVSRLDEEMMDCDSTQIPDVIRMTCHDVLCHRDRQLANGICRPMETKFSDTCFSVFIKFTPRKVLQRDKFILADMVRTGLTMMMDRMLDQSTAEKDKRSFDALSNKTQSFLFFYNTNDMGNFSYIVVYIQTVLQSSLMKGEFLKILKKNIPVLNDDYLEDLENWYDFFRELAVYNLSVSGESTTIYVPFKDTKLVDELVFDAGLSDTMICHPRDTVQLNELHLCPHAVLDADAHEFPGEVRNDYLYFQDNGWIASFSKWQYEIHDDKIHICLHDYFNVYDAMIAAESPGPVVSSRATVSGSARDNRYSAIAGRAAVNKLLLSFDFISLAVYSSANHFKA